MDDLNGENNIWLFIVSMLCFGAVGAALVSQHVYGYQPCAWCVLQRIIFLAIGLISLIGFITKTNIVTPIFSVLLACIGQFVAVYQFFVASKSFDCYLSFAEKFITSLSLDKIIPGLFEIRAMCADASAPLMGISYEIWSYSAFLLVAILSVIAYINRHRFY